MIPYVYFNHSLEGVVCAVIRIIIILSFLIVVYLVNGICAGDVKLLAMISGYFMITDCIKLIILIFYIAAFFGIIKIIISRIESGKVGRTGIKFSGPILLGYCVLYISKGGIY